MALDQTNYTNCSCAGNRTHVSSFAYDADSLNATIGKVVYLPQGDKPLPELPEWNALSQCCEDPKNMTKLADDCVLWCVLSNQTYPPGRAHNELHDDTADAFSTCIQKTQPGPQFWSIDYPSTKANLSGPGPSTTTSMSPSQPTDGGAATQTAGPNAGSILNMPGLKSVALLVLALGGFQMAV
ncbi:hypothetical protein PG994_007276 [Apiospora phragmitis]|uniref:Uncharacterized protein n=1 Tax=Apiospora phragmitis TaxID=2905665 RepID=A0ABR1V3P0_9PEZI